jgi:hypothetical protein
MPQATSLQLDLCKARNNWLRVWDLFSLEPQRKRIQTLGSAEETSPVPRLEGNPPAVPAGFLCFTARRPAGRWFTTRKERIRAANVKRAVFYAHPPSQTSMRRAEPASGLGNPASMPGLTMRPINGPESAGMGIAAIVRAGGGCGVTVNVVTVTRGPPTLGRAGRAGRSGSAAPVPFGVARETGCRASIAQLPDCLVGSVGPGLSAIGLHQPAPQAKARRDRLSGVRGSDRCGTTDEGSP